MNELSQKLGRIRRFLSQHKIAAALFGNQSNFAWITGGKDAHVVLAAETAAASILVTPRRCFLLSDTIEEPRLYAEEIERRIFEPLIFPWHDAAKALRLLRKIIGKGKIISDNGAHGIPNRGSALARLRWELLPEEILRYREIGAIASRSLEKACRTLKPGMTEHEITALIASEVFRQGAIPHVLLAAVDERVAQFRHPIPTRKKLRRHAMLVVCAKKHGLIANVTRLVHFGKLPRDLRKRHDAVCLVDCAFNLATRPGAKAHEIFRAGMAAYARQGYRGEWKRHHQGGATGYAGRDWIATPHHREAVLENQAFAWNPSIAGTKSEDTILVQKDGLEILTLSSSRWPTVHIHHPHGCIERPDILVR